ncbi:MULTISPECIES: gephyrin-like molybdotransferase receptor GlpR [unclassified Nocardia]|uniref:divisome protein SepX/GlpR n=1 Tax=unclassified Nocardia TaxID=2637762 RepID=UPI001CE4AC50|nr:MULTISPECIES: gephyrin-like molybdotransferase receptor GlpR [unclassified Nocardia]
MPNSILWIGLVVLWVFVLFPILADRHPRIRQTTDAALATRVLHRGGSKRRAKKGPAAGHESDPDYRPTRAQRRFTHSDDAEDRMTTPAEEPVTEADDETAGAETGSDTTDSHEHEVAEPAGKAEHPTDADESVDDDEVDSFVDEPEPARARIPPARSAAPARVRDEPENYSGDDEFDEDEFVPSRRGRGGFDPEADAIARAARYTFRQRAVLALILAALSCGGVAIAVTPLLWWGCGAATLILVTYLAYLRKQVRMEEDIRRRRAARLSRAQQLGEAPAPRRAEHRPPDLMDRDTARALRRRSVLLEPDDEDPMFEHLDPFDPATARAVRTRAAGGEMRRAAGA